MKNTKMAVQITSVDKNDHNVWMCIMLSKTANVDAFIEAFIHLMELYEIKAPQENLTSIPYGGHVRIVFALPYPDTVFQLPEKYEIFKAAQRAINQLLIGDKPISFQAKRNFIADLTITQFYQRFPKEVANVG